MAELRRLANLPSFNSLKRVRENDLRTLTQVPNPGTGLYLPKIT